MVKTKFKQGDKFWRLTVIENINGKYWVFKCDCGKDKIANIYNVKSGNVKSCGCLHLERCKSGLNRLKHGDAKKGKVTRLHSLWRAMIYRCNHDKNYYGRGIKVCNEWNKDYLSFKKWALNNGFKKNLTIGRIDNDGDYSPENCRFENLEQQARNRRNTRYVTINGVTKTCVEWAEELNINYETVRYRLDNGHEINVRSRKGIDKPFRGSYPGKLGFN